MNGRQKMTVIIIDFLLLVQLTYSVYAAQQNPPEIAWVFIKTYLPMVLITLIIGKVALRKLRTRGGEAEEAVGDEGG